MRAAIILAGGEGTRLRTLTRALSGDDRPKQFCAVLGGETLLGRTRRRVARLVSPSETAVVVTRAHDRFWSPAIDAIPSQRLVVQPEGRGTAPAILYALMRLSALGPTAPVAIFPSDHWFSDDDRFMAAVATAYDAVETFSGTVVLLGLPPDRPEPQYGWIEPGPRLPGPWPLLEVHRFIEKPSRLTAERLYAAGGLWNAFVLVGQRWALLDLFRETRPDLLERFAPLRGELGTAEETSAARRAYLSIPSVDFSRDILQARPSGLAALRVSDVAWNDLGDPERVRATLARAEAATAGVRSTLMAPARR